MELLNCVMLRICSSCSRKRLEQAGTQSSLLRAVETCVDQAMAILACRPWITSGAELRPEQHDLHAEDIHFSYGEKPIINGITLDIPERTTTAIVGPSGGGKTTLCHLLSRFWDVDGGRVTLGGHDVREYDMDSLMRNFSFVFQSVLSFSMIRSPITSASASRTRRWKRWRKRRRKPAAMTSSWLCRRTLDTIIGEGGTTLSGGERQRLSIARAIMKDAPIIILDEASSKRRPGE